MKKLSIFFLIILFCFSAIAESVKKKLIDAKNLYEQKLISKKDYEELKKKILFTPNQNQKVEKKILKKFTIKEKKTRVLILPFTGTPDYEKANDKLYKHLARKITKRYPETRLSIIPFKKVKKYLRKIGRTDDSLTDQYTKSEIQNIAKIAQTNIIIFGNFNHLSIEQVVQQGYFTTVSRTCKCALNFDFSIYKADEKELLFKGNMRKKYTDGFKTIGSFTEGVMDRMANYVYGRFFKKYRNFPR